MNTKLIASGAEASILLSKNIVIKDRIKKSYRLSQLDYKLRRTRTKKEKKLLEKASLIINCPSPIPNKDETKILLPYISGKKLSEYLDSFSKPKAQALCKKIGESLAKLHDAGIIHGDLTTSNMILDKKNNVWFIDFGLGFFSERIEDKAVDLHLIKQALEAKHFKNWDNYFTFILKGYKSSKNSVKVIEQLKKVESRGRYKEKY